MPRYLGKGSNFYLVVCEHVAQQGTSKQAMQQNVERFCMRCGLWRDAFQRAEVAEKKGKQWRRLICVHPKDKATLEKWKPHVTVWAK